jgi:hypothetical protein
VRIKREVAGAGGFLAPSARFSVHIRRALQDLIAPELKELTNISRGHADALNGIVGMLKKHSQILR